MKHELPKCGSDQMIQDLVRMANDANIKDPEFMKELEEYNCNLTNCQETKWTVSSWQRAVLGGSDHDNVTKIILNFPSSSKVLSVKSIFKNLTSIENILEGIDN